MRRRSYYHPGTNPQPHRPDRAHAPGEPMREASRRSLERTQELEMAARLARPELAKLTRQQRRQLERQQRKQR